MALYPNLKITKWVVSEESEIQATDYSVFLLRESPVFTKGRKTYSEYKDPDTLELIVKVTYEDRYEAMTGNLIGIDRVIDWYDSEGLVGLSKSAYSPMNKAEAANEKRARRIRSIDYLKSAGKDTPIEPYMDAIFTHYEDVVRFWYDMGGTGVADAVAAETDPTILAYLAIETEPQWTVAMGITYQTTHPWD